MKNNFIVQQLLTLFSTQRFKLILLLTIGNAFYATMLSNPQLDYLSALTNILSFPYYNIILLVIILISIFSAISFFNDSEEYIIRLGTVDQKNKQMSKLCILQTIVICFMQTILLITLMNFFHNNEFNFMLQIKGTNIIIYLLFHILKTYIMLGIITYGVVYFSNYFNKYIIAIILLAMFLAFPLGIYDGGLIIDSLSISLFIPDYFYGLINSNFLLELIGSIIFSIVFLIIILIFIDICKFIKKKKLLRTKSLIYRSVVFITNEKKKYLILYIILVISCLLLRKLLGIIPTKQLFLDILGLNFNLNGDILANLCSMLYFVYFIYIAIALFINDLQDEKQNLFLRISYKDWLKKSLIALFIGTMILRILIYIVFIMFYVCVGGMQIPSIDILKVFIIDFAYILIIQCYSVITYSNFLLKKYCMCVLNIFIILAMILFNQFSRNLIMVLIIVSICCLCFQIYRIRRYSYTKILNESGGK